MVNGDLSNIMLRQMELPMLHAKARATTQLKRTLVSATLMLLLFGCGTAPVRENTPEIEQRLSLEEIPALLENTLQSAPQERLSTLFLVTETLIQYGETDWARNTFSEINPNRLAEGEALRYYILATKLALKEGQPFLAKRYLWHRTVELNWEYANQGQLITLHELRASLLFDLSEYQQSISERLALELLLENDPIEQALNQDLLWQTLMELSLADLQLESQRQMGEVAEGWYTLAALSKDNQTNLRLQLEEVERWALQWPSHPASLRLPADLQILKQLAEQQPSQIAVLLPLSGRFEKAAEAIRDGIMAAYYHAAAQGDQLPELRIYDTQVHDINNLYDEVVSAGAKLIIGPLEKEKISELALRPELPVPTLALNRIDSPVDEPQSLYQFGLAPEDEAIQVAMQAWRDGHRRVALLAPSTQRGDRSIASFSETWRILGGEIINDYRYASQKTYSKLVKNAVGVAASEQRKNKLRRLLGKPIEFEPRRRQDIDFIFMPSYASQARQLNPILAFHYAGDIPVYSISDIYNGKQDVKMNRDLNNIRFTTLPWFFETLLPEKTAIEQYSNSSQFLYALGVDSYHLHPRLTQLDKFKNAHFYGATGKLTLDDDRKIRRQQVWAKFIGGKAVIMPSLGRENDL